MFRVVDVRRFRRDAVQLDHPEALAPGEVLRAGCPDVEAAEIEAVEARDDALDRCLELGGDQVFAFQENRPSQCPL